MSVSNGVLTSCFSDSNLQRLASIEDINASEDSSPNGESSFVPFCSKGVLMKGSSSCMSASHLDRLIEEEEIEDARNVINKSSNNQLSCSPRRDSSKPNKGLHVLFLSSDTGGGHRASAESLGKQFELLFPGSTYELLDVVEKDGVPPYNSLVSTYKHLSNHPSQWKLVYSVSNSRAFEVLADAHLKLMCERAVRRRIKSYNPDVVVSVHPLMTNVPVLSCSKISAETGRHLPIFTVVTDLGSAHCLWFANGVEKMFVGSEAIRQLAKSRGKVPDEKLILSGLPIRHDFAIQAELLGDRYSPEGQAYQRKIRCQLKLPPMQTHSCSSSRAIDAKENDSQTGCSPKSSCTNNFFVSEAVDRATLLVMGGGEGVGSLENIADALYLELKSQGINALILVICGRNEKLKSWIEQRDWDDVYTNWLNKKTYGITKTKHNNGSATRGILSNLSIADTCRTGGSTSSSLTNISPHIVPPSAMQHDISATTSETTGTANIVTGCMESPASVTERIRAMLFASRSGSIGTAVLSKNILSIPPFLRVHESNDDPGTNIKGGGYTNEDATTGYNYCEDEGDHLSYIDDTGVNGSTASAINQDDESKDIHLTRTNDIISPSESTDLHTTNTVVLGESYDLVSSLVDNDSRPGDVTVVGLGFIDQMAEYMVASDILITKAGPGTISEAAALSLPVMLTSFLPGQEEGNVDYVINGGFGGYCDVSDPTGIADEICIWLQDPEKLKKMSENAKSYGKPYAARDIAKVIGESTLRWLEHNQEVIQEKERKRQESEKPPLLNQLLSPVSSLVTTTTTSSQDTISTTSASIQATVV